METFFRAIAILICFVLLIGFGMCGLFGVVAGITGGGIGVLGLGLVGIVISGACIMVVRDLFKPGKTKNKSTTP